MGTNSSSVLKRDRERTTKLPTILKYDTEALEEFVSRFRRGDIKGANKHEIETCWDVSTLENSITKCQKNPGHSKFIPIRTFGVGHLPASSRDKEVVKYIKAAGAFVVRVISRYTSTDRPDDFACSEFRGTDRIRLATGFARIPGEAVEFPCPIPDCPYNRKAHNVYGKISIITNYHVVFDQSEALQTRAQFNFDHPAVTTGLPVVQCISLDYASKDTDVAHLNCVTHDEHFYNILCQEMERLTSIYRNIAPEIWQNCRNLCVVISHPHGLDKRVSVGQHRSFSITATQGHAHCYNSSTCPGSSGAPVFYVSTREKGATPMWIPAIHSFYEDDTNLNCGFR